MCDPFRRFSYFPFVRFLRPTNRSSTLRYHLLRRGRRGSGRSGGPNRREVLVTRGLRGEKGTVFSVKTLREVRGSRTVWTLRDRLSTTKLLTQVPLLLIQGLKTLGLGQESEDDVGKSNKRRDDECQNRFWTLNMLIVVVVSSFLHGYGLKWIVRLILFAKNNQSFQSLGMKLEQSEI